MKNSNPCNNPHSKAAPAVGFLAACLATCALLATPLQTQAQTTVSVDTTRAWIGYMNVFDINADGTPNYGVYRFGSQWGIADLRGYFTGTNFLTLTPCTNVWNPTDAYWVNANGTANKWIDASFYVQDDTLAGQSITFSGTCLTNSLTAPANSVAFIKDFVPSYASSTAVTAPLVPGQPFTLTLQTAAGGHHIQYGFETQGPDVSVNPTLFANAGKVVIAVNNLDPSLPSLTSLALVEGQNASFSIKPTGTSPFHYQWTYVNATTTNVLSNGGRISGATNGTLTISNVVAADAGTYIVTVTNTRGSANAIAGLSVVPLAQVRTNLLINPGFENDAFAATSDAGWYNFNGAVLQNTNNNYFFSSTFVTVVEGTNCLETYSTGLNSYNGAFQDRPALPGQVYTADAWFLTPTDDQISGTNVCYLEVQFRNAAGTALVQYSTATFDATFPTGTWIQLVPTNIHAGDFVTPLGTSPYMVAPAGTASVRYQFTYHGQDGNGSVYIDDAVLKLREPVVTVSASGSSVALSFPTLYGPSYQVYFKTNLTDTTWSALGGPVTGDGTVQTVHDPAGSARRFYTVNTLQ